MINFIINLSYKVLVMRVLPLPLFFIKVNGLLAVYRIILVAMLVLME